MAETSDCIISEESFGAIRISRHRLSKLCQTRFSVIWADGSPPTWEPLESMLQSPTLVRDYERKVRRQFQRKNIGRGEVGEKFHFTKIPHGILSKYRHPIESYEVRGFEKIIKILDEVKPVDGPSVTLWGVWFQGEHCPHYVNKNVVVYYFPFQACMFLRKLARTL